MKFVQNRVQNFRALHYLKQRQRPTLWYRLDEGDRDPAVFLHHLAWAASRMAPDDDGPDLSGSPGGIPEDGTLFHFCSASTSE